MSRQVHFAPLSDTRRTAGRERIPARTRSGRRRTRQPVDNAFEDAPTLSLRLLSTEGDVFEIPAATVWHHSPLIRNLVEDSGPNEDDTIPLPGVATSSLGTLLDACKSMPPASKDTARSGVLLRAPELSLQTLAPTELTQLFWAAQLLEMERVESQILGSLAQKLEVTRPAFRGVAMESLLLLLRKGATHASSELACDLIRAVAHEPSAVEALEATLDHQNEDVKSEAETALFAIGSLNALRAVLIRGSYGGRMNAARALPRSCLDAMEVVLELLQSASWQVRETAVYALSLVASRGDTQTIDRLAGMLEDPIREVRNAAVSAFRRVAEPDDASTVESVWSHLANTAWPIQCATLNALAIVAPGRPELIESFVQGLEAGAPTPAKHIASKILKDLKAEASDCDEQRSVATPTRILTPTRTLSSSSTRWGDMLEE